MAPSTRYHALLVVAVTAALSPTRRAALKAKKEVPVFDANVYKKKYYANFAEAKISQLHTVSSSSWTTALSRTCC